MNARHAMLLLLCTLTWVQAAIAEGLVGRVVRVQDGDTLTVVISHKQIKVRLIDIDAPEKKQPFGTRSWQSLSEICGGKYAQVDDRGMDRFGRTLGQVRCAGVDANAEQVRRGHGLGVRALCAQELATLRGAD